MKIPQLNPLFCSINKISHIIKKKKQKTQPGMVDPTYHLSTQEFEA
jgi:hypothetical protein